MQRQRIRAWLTGTQSRRLALGFTLLLLGGLAWQLAQLTWLLVPEGDAERLAPALPAAPAGAPVPARDRVDLSRIAQWHLFGKAEEGAPARPSAEVPVDAPETRLNLVLRGVLASESRSLARAIIAEERGEERMYKVGDRLPGNAELVEILADRVILRRGGRHETLRLPKEGLEPASRAVRTAAAAGAAAGGADAAAILRRYRQQLQTNPRSLIELVRPIPETRNNRFNGFRLFPGSRPELFRKLGLRPGDLVTEVNGIPLDSPAKGIQILKDLKEADEIQLRIRRGRREMNLSFRLS